MKEIIEKINLYTQLCSCSLKLSGRSKPQLEPYSSVQIKNFQQRHRSRKQTNKQKHTQHTHAEVVATYLHFSPSVVSEYTHQFAATKTQFCKHSSCAFLSLIRKTEKNETTSTTPKVEKGYDHSLSRGGGVV